jgi:hypothetical protein
MNIPVIEIDQVGNISTLYNDEINLYEIGTVTHVRRASFIEFNEKRQWWEVIDVVTEEVVYQNKIREKCIKWEIINFGPGGRYYNETVYS